MFSDMNIELIQGMLSISEIEEYDFSFYERMLHFYWDTKGLIPTGNLVEARFEDLEDKPLEVVKRIYSELSLPDFENNKDNFKRYITSQNDYKKNRFTADKKTINRISKRWHFPLKKLQYSLPREFADIGMA